MITADEFRARFRYDPETGFVYNLKFNRLVGHTDDKGYVRILIDKIFYRAHRLAFLYMNGEWPSEQVDHIDRNRSNNRWVNLRDVSNWTNSLNRSLRQPKIYVIRIENNVVEVILNNIKIFKTTSELGAMQFISKQK